MSQRAIFIIKRIYFNICAHLINFSVLGPSRYAALLSSVLTLLCVKAVSAEG